MVVVLVNPSDEPVTVTATVPVDAVLLAVRVSKLVVVVLLTGGRPVSGPAAAGIAGDLYRQLGEQNYFASNQPLTPATLVGSEICCR